MGAIRLEGLNIAKYENGTVCLAEIISSVFQKKEKTTSEVISGLRLGWDSYAEFSKSQDGFKISTLKKLDEFGEKDNTKEVEIIDSDKNFNQIFTRTVDTCTFCFLQCKDLFLIGHFDKKILGAAANVLKGFVQDKQSVTAIFSILKTKEETDFVNEFYENNKHNSDVYVFYRSDNANYQNGYKSHLEIGVNFDGGAPKVYGDIITRDIQHDNTSSALAITFDDMMQEIKLEHKVERGGNCVIE